MTTATLAGHRDRFDWLLYLLVFVAIVTLPLSILSSGWVPGAERLLMPALWSSILAAILARSRWTSWVCWAVGLTLGLFYAAQYATGVLPSPGLLLGDVVGAVGWLVEWAFSRTMPSPRPFVATVGHVVANAEASAAALRSWFSVVRVGGVSEDVTVLWFLVSLATWVLGWNATFEMIRNQRPMASLLPLGVAVVANSAVTRLSLAHVQVYIGAMLVILAYANMNRMHAIWERFGVDFSTELKRDSLFAGAAIAVLALVLALAMPYTTYNRAVYAFWDRFGPTLESIYDELDRVFAGRDPVPEPESASSRDIAMGVLPHDVGLGSGVSDRTVMMVTISDPPPPPIDVLEQMAASEAIDPRRFVERRYWRQRTYDVYNGSGWDTSERNTLSFAPQQSWTEIVYPNTVVTQTFTLREVRGNVVFGINEPVSVDLDYQVLYRGEGDFVALAVDADEYTVVSYVPQPTVEELRAAEDDYSPEIAERYVALPEIPVRVAALAQEIIDTAGAVTRYDKARAIESYLRGYTYDLEVAPPPLDQDIVEYFLFDLQRGYCDYSASAMVVMLRSVGVASRYASGYGMGTYDYMEERWRVTGQNAHAWAEVYFPGLGWIEFEPTPTELPRAFAGGDQSYSLPDRPLMNEPAPAVKIPWRGIGGGALVLALTVGLALAVSGSVPYRPTSGGDSRQVIWRIYASLARRASWLNLYPQDGQTPGEFLASLADELEARGSYSGAIAHDVSAISTAYVRARYASGAMTAQDRDEALMAWNRLKPTMFKLLFVRGQRARA